MNRRAFVRGSVAGLLGGGLFACGGPRGVAGSGTEPVEDRCDQPFEHAMARVGALYLQAHPDEADELRLTRSLGARRGASIASVIRTSQSAHERDATAGRLVAVAGWMVTHTEARIFALAEMRRRRRAGRSERHPDGRA